MGMLKVILSQVLIAEATTPGTAPAWTGTPGPLNLGDLKGKTFMKLTWQNTVDTQRGKQPLGIDAKMETNSLDVLTSATLTALQALRGKNVWMHCIPTGVVSATNPIVDVKDFPLFSAAKFRSATCRA